MNLSKGTPDAVHIVATSQSSCFLLIMTKVLSLEIDMHVDLPMLSQWGSSFRMPFSLCPEQVPALIRNINN